MVYTAMIKVWCYKLKKKSDLYAFTATKDFKKEFENIRDMKSFDKKTFVFTENEFRLFMSINKNQKLERLPLSCGSLDSSIIGTYEEEIKLEETINQLSFNAHSIITKIDRYPIKKKYIKIIKEFCNITTKEYDKHILLINEFKLFYELFKETFDSSVLENKCEK